jgi:beta-galactosidase
MRGLSEILIACIIAFGLLITRCCSSNSSGRNWESLNENWQFLLAANDSVLHTDSLKLVWRNFNLPHDRSIKGEFGEKNPTDLGRGALPGGIVWYKKVFNLDFLDTGKKIFINFDGVYRISDVYINGHFLGKRPNGYISFQYDLTPYLQFGNEENTILVKIDNSLQQNSRCYSEHGIYRNIWLAKTDQLHLDLWGAAITSKVIDSYKAVVQISNTLKNDSNQKVKLTIINEIKTHKKK